MRTGLHPSPAVRRRRILLAGTLTVLALSACSIRTPGAEPLDTAIPKAFLASDLGITASEADLETSGFGMHVWASAEFETGAVTAEDLGTMLRLVVENTHLSRVNTLEILGWVGPYENDVRVDLGALGAQLGFADEEPQGTDDPNSFSADWDDVVAYLDE